MTSTTIIRFFHRTYQQLAAALYALNRRYKIVRLYRTLQNGLFYGHFEVSGRYNKTPKWDVV